MKIRRITQATFALALVASLTFSCKKGDPTPNKGSETSDTTSKGPYDKGLLITNEGSFGNDNSSISFYSYEKDTVINEIYKAKNGRNPGDVLQSITVNDYKAYIVVNNSNKVEIANRYTMEALDVMTVDQPRYVTIANGFGYITSWANNSVIKFDTASFDVLNTIPAKSGPDKMVVAGNSLYVVNTGGWSSDSTISVIDLATDNVIKTIEVGINPKDIVVDGNNNVWVLCYGAEIYNSDWTAIIGHRPSTLIKINSSNNMVEAIITLFDEQHPAHLEIDKDGSTFYLGGGYTFGGVYKVTENGSNYSATQIISDYAYGVDYDATSDALFVTISSFTSDGMLKRYDTDGNLKDSYACKVGPSSVQLKMQMWIK